MSLLSGGQKVGRNVFLAGLFAQVIKEDRRLHREDVDHALEAIFRANRQLDDGRLRAEAINDHTDTALKVRADAIHLIDEADTRDVILISLTPDRLRLRFDTGDSIEHHHATIENAQRALDLNGEVHVAGGVNDIHPVVNILKAPRSGGGRRGDGDTALLLLRHPVHRRGTLMNLADLIGAPGIKQDALRRRGFARVDVGDDSDISDFFELNLAWHTRRYCYFLRTRRYALETPAGLCAQVSAPQQATADRSGRRRGWPQPSYARPRGA